MCRSDPADRPGRPLYLLLRGVPAPWRAAVSVAAPDGEPPARGPHWALGTSHVRRSRCRWRLALPPATMRDRAVMIAGRSGGAPRLVHGILSVHRFEQRALEVSRLR